MALLLISMLALLATVSMRSTEKSGLDSQARNALVSFTAAQNLQHDTLGFYAETPEQALTVLAGFTFTSAATASSSDTEISFKTGSEGGFEFVAAAALSSSGRCFLTKVFEPSSSTPDIRRFFEPGSITCSANSTDFLSGGESW